MKPTLDRTNLLAQVCGAVCLGLSALLVVSPFQSQASDPLPQQDRTCPSLTQQTPAEELGRTAGL